jgi:protein-tyrosine phosphatase
MIDIHLHVLPGIDDGADDLATAAAMCRMAAADGCEALVLTPHQRTESWDNTDRPRLDALRSAVEAETGGSPRLYAGAEIRIDAEILAELDGLPASGLVSLADSRYLLLEFARWGMPPDPLELTHELRVAGWVPVYAHPEHIPFLADDLDLMARLSGLGALFQVTADSLTGDHGRLTRDRATRMVDAGLIHFVASDAHGTQHRPPGLSRVREVIARRWGEDTAFALTEGNPRAVVEDRPPAEVAA